MTARLTRRDALKLGLGTALGLGAAGCGSDNGPLSGPHTRAVERTSIAIDYASYYAPAPDLIRLAQDHARARGLATTFSDDPSGSAAQVASVKALTGPRGGFKVVVVAPFDAAVLDAIVQDAMSRGVSVVSFVSPLRHATAAIGVDAAGAARQLVSHARAHAGHQPQVLLVLPPARSPIPDPFFGYATGAAQALRQATAAAGLDVAATVTALGTPDGRDAVRAALAQHPDVTTVLTWNDATALGAAAALPRTAYVGGLGAPAVTTAAPLHALDAGGPLRCLVAARLATLAGALIDVPATVLKGAKPSTAPVPIEVFTAGAQTTRAALKDYAA
ncbi:MAG TPA: substrate-binding domain-containing protein [Baekduia sp.]